MVIEKTGLKESTVSAPAIQGYITDIKRFAVHDGPGVRTTVFLKGCSLNCIWCHNPETISLKPELMLYFERCIGCGACFEACPHGAHEATDEGRVFHRELCTACGLCADACYSGAIKMAGKLTTVDAVLDLIRQDIPFYRTSGGGVTLSGGEPLMQPDFARAILQGCKDDDIHTALDTCGNAHWNVIKSVLPYVDLVLYDLKHISPSKHRTYTGTSNELILKNLRRLADYGVTIEVRMLVIPTINDSRLYIERAAKFLASLNGVIAVRLLAYHSMAGSKYSRLDKPNTLPEVALPDDEQLRCIAGWMEPYGLVVSW
jgi:pyruvate formate lyase activating enzyme